MFRLIVNTPVQDPMADSDEEDEDDFTGADTYANYAPTKGK